MHQIWTIKINYYQISDAIKIIAITHFKFYIWNIWTTQSKNLMIRNRWTNKWGLFYILWSTYEATKCEQMLGAKNIYDTLKCFSERVSHN